MEEDGNKGEFKGNLPRKLGVRTYAGGMKSSFSGRSSPRGSPSVRRPHSDRDPRREPKAFASEFRWIRSNRIFLWLMLILLWAYIGFHVQSRWAHGEHKWKEFISRKNKDTKKPADLVASPSNSSASRGVVLLEEKDLKSWNSSHSKSREVNVDMPGQNSKKKSSRKSKRKVKKPLTKSKDTVSENQTSVVEEGLVSRRNTSYGLIVGPFGKIEDNILEWNADKRRGTCNRKGDFARIVWSRTFVLIFHELSMTGAPISMMELATEILSCGGSVSAVVLSRKGGLITELDKRGIRVLDDRAQLSFKTAMKSDLVIAGSAVCSSWIEQYLAHNPAGSSQIVWWIMENRREYFDRSKKLLSRVKMLTFLSDLQSKQWQTWCDEEQIHLNLPPMVVPLSVNDELAFVAGIPCSLNTPSFSVEKMLEKRNLLRDAIRKEMGLSDNDMLVMSLSSINPPKGQRLFLESAVKVAEHNVSLKGFETNYTLIANAELDITHQNENAASIELNHGADNLKSNLTSVLAGKATKATSKKKRKKHSKSSNNLSMENRISEGTEQDGTVRLRKLLSVNETEKEQNLKVLIGSLGSKSNKPLYLKAMLKLLSHHPHMSKLVFWTPATTRVASLYAAADVYVINAQGFGETFGRVTIEAMAFGLPVLGTDAGGTKEIVEHKVTGLLHPVGQEGIEVLARNILYLMKNPPVRKKMGMLGRRIVKKKYLKTHMYERFSSVLTKCMKIK